MFTFHGLHSVTYIAMYLIKFDRIKTLHYIMALYVHEQLHNGHVLKNVINQIY